MAQVSAVDIMEQTMTAEKLGYRSINSCADEMLDRDGNIRPVWQRFVDHFSKMRPEEISERFARTDRYLRDAGVFYRDYSADQNNERNWPISHIPVIIDGQEWDKFIDRKSVV